MPTIRVTTIPLARAGTPGLGAHLFHALNGRAAVIGVAKTKYQGAEPACVLRRGTSTRPLFVTAAGMSVKQAAEHVRSMHGAYRLPTLLRYVDALARNAELA